MNSQQAREQVRAMHRDNIEGITNAAERMRAMTEEMQPTAIGYTNGPGPINEIDNAAYLLKEKCHHKITIDPLGVGYVVHVGCRTFAIESADRLIMLLDVLLQPGFYPMLNTFVQSEDRLPDEKELELMKAEHQNTKLKVEAARAALKP